MGSFPKCFLVFPTRKPILPLTSNILRLIRKITFLSLPSLGLGAKTPLFRKGFGLFLLLDNFFDVRPPNFLSY